MIQNENNSKWLNEIRDTMADFEAELPADGWDKISSALEPKKTSIVPMWKRMSAAAIVLIVIGIGSWAIFRQKQLVSENDIAQNESVSELELQNFVPQHFEPAETHAEPQVHVSQHHLAQTPVARVENAVEEDTVASSPNTLVCDVPENSIATAEPAPQTVADSVPEAITTLRNFEEEAVLLAMEQAAPKSRHRRSWALGLSGGGALNFLDGETESVASGIEGLRPGLPDSLRPKPTPEPESRAGYGDPERVYGAYNNRSWSFGLSVSRELTRRLYLESGLVYTLLTSDLDVSHEVVSQKLHYLGVPLKLRVSCAEWSRWQLYASVGGMAEHAIYATLDEKSFSINRWQWSVNGAMGIQYSFSRSVGAYLEPEINYYFDDKTGVLSQRTERPLSFNLRLGLRFTLKSHSH
ncbi:MAG: autotransporter outer membrane beta-barrel domain-containing protein [Bacteroidales bacterium]|nr:autotransporter outer membrane beta-barrel domain-containing protein [Bacteroidales bacterium]